MKETINEPKPRKWYGKKRYLIPAAFLGGIWVALSFSSPDTTQTQNYSSSSTYVENIAPVSTPSETQIKESNADVQSVESINEIPVVVPYSDNTDEVPLSNDNTYINNQGDEIHSPAYAPSVPPGASAICGDGTYSFSQSRRGTCSHHGGVAEWL